MERTRPDLCRSPQQMILQTRLPGVNGTIGIWLATFQSSSEQREKCSHRTHIDERKHESGLFRLQTSPQMKWNLSAIQLSVTRNPVAWGTVTEHLPCLSVSVFVDVVMCASRLSSPGACSVSVCTTPLASRPKSSSTSRSAAASLFRMITDAWPLGSFAA